MSWFITDRVSAAKSETPHHSERKAVQHSWRLRFRLSFRTSEVGFASPIGHR